MKRALIITYYWPPSGGSGVQRWLKFSKYLPEYGWQPVIYTPSNPEIPAIDQSLEGDIPEVAEVIRRPIFEPYDIYRKITGGGKEGSSAVNPINNVGKKSFKQSVSLWLRANIFIPDPRIFWLNPSVKFLKRYLAENPVDVIVSTGPPHSMHLIARKVSKATGIKWVADFRDPWTRIFYFKHLPMTRHTSKLIHRMEMSVLRDADAVVTVTDRINKDFQDTIRKSLSKQTPVYTIFNGYDEDDFAGKSAGLEQDFTITHTGLFSVEGNPERLWEVLHEMCNELQGFKEHLRIRLIGKTDNEVSESLRKWGLEGNTANMGYLPHSEISSWQSCARLLMLPLRNEPEAEGILTGKFFEYLAAGRPIVAFGPKEGEMADALSKTDAGTIFDWDEKEPLKQALIEHYNTYLEADGKGREEAPTHNKEAINNYSRRKLTDDMVGIWEGLSNDK